MALTPDQREPVYIIAPPALRCCLDQSSSCCTAKIDV